MNATILKKTCLPCTWMTSNVFVIAIESPSESCPNTVTLFLQNHWAVPEVIVVTHRDTLFVHLGANYRMSKSQFKKLLTHIVILGL